MADITDTPPPMTDDDITPPPATTTFEPAEPLKNAGVAFDATTQGGEPVAGTQGGESVAGAPGVGATQTIKDGATKLSQQAGDKARSLAEDGKARAAGGLDQLSQMLTDAAGQVDGKLGEQYGQYARSAAGAVSGFADQIKGKDLDELVEDARAFVRKSPAVAIGAAAAAGFVLARLLSAGLDQRDT